MFKAILLDRQDDRATTRIADLDESQLPEGEGALGRYRDAFEMRRKSHA
nr:hypothetical protein [Paraburkholderia sp. BL8N3]